MLLLWLLQYKKDIIMEYKIMPLTLFVNTFAHGNKNKTIGI